MIKTSNNIFKINKSLEEIYEIVGRMNYHLEDSISLICRGDRMKTWCGFSNELSAVLQFPYYFSNGFDSLDECISDLSWILKKRIFVFITNAELILFEQKRDFLVLFEDSVNRVPVDMKKYYNEDKYVYYIFQNIDKDFPIFKEKAYLDISNE